MELEEMELGQERGSSPWLDLGRCPGQEGGTGLAIEGINKR